MIIWLEFLSEMAITRVNYLQYKNLLLELSSNVKVTVFGVRSSRFSLSGSGESKFALRHPCLLTGVFPHCDLRLFFPWGKPCRDVPPRKLNSSNEPRRACVIEKTSREIGKEFLNPVRFFFRNHRSIRIDYDRKKCARLFQQVFVCFFAKINIFRLVLTCNPLLNN